MKKEEEEIWTLSLAFFFAPDGGFRNSLPIKSKHPSQTLVVCFSNANLKSPSWCKKWEGKPKLLVKKPALTSQVPLPSPPLLVPQQLPP
jgi:hypothetical protein